MGNREVNRWKGFVLGNVAGIGGVLTMRYYWKAAQAVVGHDPRKTGKKQNAEEQPLHSISLVGKHHKEGESTTAAMGRILYKAFTGKEPEAQETRTTLSYIVHWVFTMLVSGAYGAIRGAAGVPDLKGGLALSIELWLLGDELGVGLLGLADGPGAYKLELHAHGLAAHLAYGTTTAAVTQALEELL